MISSNFAAINKQIENYYKNGSFITIETPDLFLISVQDKDLPFYQQVYTDPETMKLYIDCQSRLQEKGEAAWKEEQLTLASLRVVQFTKRWFVNKDPLSEFVLWKKENHSLRPIGFITASCVGQPGKVEAALVICKEEHNRAYGTQAVAALVQKYLPALIEVHYKLFGKPLLADGLPLEEVFATAHPNNRGSIRLMEKCGMTMTNASLTSRWGGPRVCYTWKLQERAKL